MTEERKEELRQLLQKATAPENLEIGDRFSFLPINVYRTYLQQYRTSYWVHFNPHIVNEGIKLKLINFIREEFAPFIREDLILPASYFLFGGPSEGFSLDDLLTQLLKITIAHGVERVVSDFDRCTTDKFGSVQYIALLEGIRLKTEIQVFDGIRLVPLSNSTLELPRYLSNISISGTSVDFFLEKTLLIIDCSVSPIFHKPFGSITFQEYDEREKRAFQIEMSSKDFPYLKVDDFPVILLCQALALACNSAVEISLVTRFLAEDKLYNLNFGIGGGVSMYRGPFGTFAEAGQPEIDKAKFLYNILVNPSSNLKERLRITIDRWIKSKVNKDPVDRIIDLGIALESLYLSGTESKNEIRFRFSLHAAWHLGENKEHREGLMKKFKAIYDWRSAVVHTGKLPEKGRGKKKKSYTQEEVREFIRNAQDLCRDSIMKILEEGKFPDWNNLILG